MKLKAGDRATLHVCNAELTPISAQDMSWIAKTYIKEST